jgi:dTDP-4-amino-4,6-dideoxygalactose transaminase
MKNIPVFKPLLENEEFYAARKSLEVGWLGMGEAVGQFEDALKKYIGCKDRHIAAVSTGHAALHLAMIIARVGSDDEVITPSFNNIADFQAILAVGAKPVFCDINDDTLCIDIDKAENLITPRTRAIIVMDYDCILCDHDSIARFAEKYNLRVIHDAAHSFGSFYKGKKIGTFSDICMFSFDPVKTITCIDGGAIIVKTKDELEIIHELRLIGMGQSSSVMYKNQRAWTYDVKRIGFRYHMANLHAAIGLAQLKKMDRISKVRKDICSYYNAQLSSISDVRLPKTDFNNVTPFLYYIRVPERKRDSLRKFLSANGVDTGIHWQPGHWFSLLKDYPKGDLKVTEKVGREILSLPLSSSMTKQDVDQVVKAIKDFF